MTGKQDRKDSRKRRVLHVNRVGFVGGTERVILTIGSGLKNSKFEFVLACPEGDLASQARLRNIEVRPAPFSRMRITANPITIAGYPFAWRRAAISIDKICQENAIDIIHAHHPVSGLYCLPAVRSLGLPLVLHVHDGPPVKPLYALALRRVARRAKKIICVSSAAKRTLEISGWHGGQVKVIHNGVDPLFLGPAPLPAADVVGPGPHVAVFGVIEPRKGQDVFLQAAKELASDWPNAHFWIIGARNFRDKANYGAQLDTMCASGPLAGRVTFTGFRSDIASLMQAMDVVTLTSVSHETFGMTLVEAMALGRPVVTSGIGATAEIVADGDTGLVVPIKDSKALARAIARALGPMGRQLGIRAAVEVRARFSPAAFCDELAAVYDEC
jgi:glycosyltransferase involved in cell wall biosynthesis